MREGPECREATAAARDQEDPAANDGQYRDDEHGTGIVTAFGRQLKLLRARAGLERPEFGSLMNYSASSIASFEQGRRIPLPTFIDKADEVLGAGGLLKALKKEVVAGPVPQLLPRRRTL